MEEPRDWKKTEFKWNDENKIGDEWGDEIYAGPLHGWKSKEEYNQLLKDDKLGIGEQATRYIAGTIGQHIGDTYKQIGEYIPDITPSDKIKDAVNVAGQISGKIYDWTIKENVEHVMAVAEAPVKIVHKASKLQYEDGKINFGGRGIGKSPLEVGEALIPITGGFLKTGGKKLLKTTDNILDAVRVSRQFNPALATVGDGIIPKITKTATNPNVLASTTLGGGLGGASISQGKKLTKTKVLSEPLYDVNTTDVNRTTGGYKGDYGEYPKGMGNQGLANIMYNNIPGLKLKFGKLRSLQQEFTKHHHIEDIAFTGKWANTSDFKEVFEKLKDYKIYPGDSPTNIIGMMDEGNKFLQTGKTSLIQELKKTNFPGLEKIEKYSDLSRADAPKGIKKLIDTVFKSPEYGDEFFPGSINKLGEKTPNQMQAMFETLPNGKRISSVLPAKEIHPEVWRTLGLDTASKEFLKLPTNQKQLLKAETWSKRWETLGVNRKNIKYDPSKMILSKDHIDTLHYKVYNSPEFIQKRQLEQMIDDGSYYKLTAEQKAEKIAEVYTIQKNASINVARNRLKLIKDYLKEAEPIRYRDMYSKDPNKLRQWIKDNNGIAANLGWYPKKGKVPDFKTLTNPDTAKITPELKIVFSTLVQ